jgi:hypothetical protein
VPRQLRLFFIAAKIKLLIDVGHTFSLRSACWSSQANPN